MNKINTDIIKTEEMKRFEEETGKKSIWQNKVTDGFKKWQEGQKTYNINRDRIAIYAPEGKKAEWTQFAKNNGYSTLSKLIRKALDFYIDYYTKFGSKNHNLDLLSNISHDLKEPLTSAKAYLQLILEEYVSTLDSNLVGMIKNSLSQFDILEHIIMNKLNIFEEDKDKKMKKEESQYDILIIEDNSETANFFKLYLPSKGLSCKVAASGMKAIDELKNSTPKLILLDIILPDINGYEVLKSIKSIDYLQEIPVIFLTAIPRTEVENKAKELDINDIIFKPFNLDDLKVIFKYFDIHN